MKKAYFYNTPYGKIGIAENGKAVTNVFFGNTVAPQTYKEENTPLLQEAAKQLNEYFNGQRKVFENIPFELEGTDFEKSVWNVLWEIPYGEVWSYLDVAKKIGNPKACRAVGRANGLNPISIFYPCHRVIGSNGKLTGYAGGLEMKKALLELEKNNQ